MDICAVCGKVANSSDYKGNEFVCSKCGCDVCVVLPRAVFEKLVKAGLTKKK